ncbi:MAG: twin-arginine translocation pathway signal [Burkholderiaceae bacterium]|jgi:lipid-binding SYLF domain-containing protein|nr:twin-arginine translocation pathway signal [Burkholderiaceae bacterium]
MHKLNLNFCSAALAVVVGLGGALAGCTTTLNRSEAPSASARSTMDRDVEATLTRLYTVVPGSGELVSRSAAVLVFPSVIGGSFVVGAEYGRGALREGGGQITGYYSTTAGSIGWQAGGQSKAIIYVFNTKDALDKFKSSNGWTAGVDATVAVGHMGANGSIDTQTIQQPIASFILTNIGLEAGASVGAAKITPIQL